MGIIILKRKANMADDKSPVMDALKKVIRIAMSVDGLVKGLNQVGKSLDRNDSLLCVLAEDCDDPKYKKLITALAKQNKIPLITVPSRTDLGEWTGQCKYEKSTEKGAETGKARKIKGCSSLCVRDYGEESDAKAMIEKYIQDHNL